MYKTPLTRGLQHKVIAAMLVDVDVKVIFLTQRVAHCRMESISSSRSSLLVLGNTSPICTLYPNRVRTGSESWKV